MKPAQHDLYADLGLTRTATFQELKSAYRRIAYTCHPDRAQGDETKIEQFHRASQAYEILSDPVKRRSYDSGWVPAESVTGLFRRAYGMRLIETMLPSAPRSLQQGGDAVIRVSAPAEFKAAGGVLTVRVPKGLAAAGEELQLHVPPTEKNILWALVRQIGFPGRNGASAGDLHIAVTFDE